MKAISRFAMTSLFCCSLAVIADAAFADNIRTCTKPMNQGYRLDWCLTPSKNCNKPAADAFCKKIGGDEALDQLPYDFKVGKTRIISGGQICTSPPYDHCDSFKTITCRRWDDKKWPWVAPNIIAAYCPTSTGN